MNLNDWERLEQSRLVDSDIRLLRNAIGHLIQMHAHACNEPTREFMTDALTSFVIGAITKFNLGQIEHGGDFLKDVDFGKEIRQEAIDQFWYVSGSEYKKKP